MNCGERGGTCHSSRIKRTDGASVRRKFSEWLRRRAYLYCESASIQCAINIVLGGGPKGFNKEKRRVFATYVRIARFYDLVS